MRATFTEAYRRAGQRITNPRNQWSAQKDDGSAVALTIWSDEIRKGAEPWVMDCRNHPKRDQWLGLNGNSIRKKHIQHSLSKLGGRFDLILCTAVNPLEEPRKIKTARYWDVREGFVRADEFDVESGEFRIELLVRGVP